MKERRIKYCDTAPFITRVCIIVVIPACGTLGRVLSNLSFLTTFSVSLETVHVSMTGRVLLSAFET